MSDQLEAHASAKGSVWIQAPLPVCTKHNAAWNFGLHMRQQLGNLATCHVNPFGGSRFIVRLLGMK